MKNMLWTVNWKNAYLEFLVSVLDSVHNLSPIIESLSVSPSKWELKMLIFKALSDPQMKCTTASVKDSFFT